MAQSAFKLGEIRERTERAKQADSFSRSPSSRIASAIEAFARTQLGMVEINAAGGDMVADIERIPRSPTRNPMTSITRERPRPTVDRLP